MVGSAIHRYLLSQGFTNLIFKTSKELNLTLQNEVEHFFEKNKPEYVFIAAAKVGGIYANNEYPAEFLYNNLMIETNLIHSSFKHGVKKLLFLGSSCIYPKMAPQPIVEEALLTSSLEESNKWYAIAKISGVMLCQAYKKQYGANFISAMPTNMYGKNDNYDLENSHVLPAMLRKFHEAKINNSNQVTLWGTGTPRREFLHADDLAEACLFLMLNYDGEGFLNIGSGEDISILELAEMIQKITKFEGKIVWDIDKPDGTPRKLMDISKIKNLGWEYKIKLRDGINQVYKEKFLLN